MSLAIGILTIWISLAVCLLIVWRAAKGSVRHD